MIYSINDEFQAFKERLNALGIVVHKIEKVGNANMAAFKVRYQLPREIHIREDFFWRHDLDSFEKMLSNRAM